MRAKRATKRNNPQKQSEINLNKHKQLTFLQHKTNTMKNSYTQPELYIENVVVENGIAVSPGQIVWGYDGAAGQGGDDYYDDTYGDL